ncbi:MAG: ion transporter [Cyanobacteria bacterium P01_H01_bin.15]
MTLREQVARAMDDVERPLSQGVNLTVLGLTLLSLGIFVVETFTLPAAWRTGLHYVDFALLLIFCAEYSLRLWSAPNPWRYALSPEGLIDLLSVLPELLGVLDIRFVRIFRWFRILRLLRFFKLEIQTLNVRSPDTIVFARILVSLFSIVFFYSGLIYQVEHYQFNSAFRNFLDAAYFVIVTITTVGFGDVIPLSEWGRAVTILMILTGVIVVPWQISELVKQIVRSVRSGDRECEHCGLESHDNDALFCKRCGARLPMRSPLNGSVSEAISSVGQPPPHSAANPLASASSSETTSE